MDSHDNDVAMACASLIFICWVKLFGREGVIIISQSLAEGTLALGALAVLWLLCVQQVTCQVRKSSPVHPVKVMSWGITRCTAGKSYRAAVWLPAEVVEAKRGQLLRNFLNKVSAGEVEGSPDDAIDPMWYQARALNLQAASQAKSRAASHNCYGAAVICCMPCPALMCVYWVYRCRCSCLLNCRHALHCLLAVLWEVLVKIPLSDPVSM